MILIKNPFLIIILIKNPIQAVHYFYRSWADMSNQNKNNTLHLLLFTLKRPNLLLKIISGLLLLNSGKLLLNYYQEGDVCYERVRFAQRTTHRYQIFGLGTLQSDL